MPAAHNPNQNNRPAVSTVLVSRAGLMRQSLEAMLAAQPALRVVAVAGAGLTGLKQVLQHQPGLVVIDSNLSDEDVEALLAEIKTGAPGTRCLVCAYTHRRQARLLAVGADAVILRHSSGLQWHETLLRLTQNAVTGLGRR